jgi:sugar phosphate permease
MKTSSPVTGFENGAVPTSVRWHIVALLVMFSFMTWFNRISMPVAYDEAIKDRVGISEEAMGSVYSTFLFAYMICMTPGGWFIDRFGVRLALVVMGLGSGLFGALTGLAGLPALVAAGLVLPALFAIRFLMGMFSAPVYPACSRTISFWIPKGQRAWANGLVQSAAAVGIACAFPVFGTLIDFVDWPAAFMISGTVTALLALLWHFYAPDHPAQHAAVNQAERHLIASEAATAAASDTSSTPKTGEQVAGDWLSLFRNRSLLLLTISYAAVGYIEYLFFFWMHYYFEKVLDLGKEESRTYAAILHLALAAGMIAGGWLADRCRSMWVHGKGRAMVPMLGMMAGALFLWLGLLNHETGWIVCCLALALAGVGASEATVWTTAVELGGRQGATAAGICNTGGNLGGLLAPVLTPLVSHTVMAQFGVTEAAGWQWGISLGSVVCLLGASLWWWIDADERK